MSKSKYAIARKDAPAKTLNAVKAVLDKADKNRYSVSAIYAAHNEVMGLKDIPQTCTSCLTSRVSTLRAWYGSEKQLDPQAYRNATLGETTAAQTAKPVQDQVTQVPLTDEQKAELYEAALRENLNEDSGPDEVLFAMELLASDEGSDLHEYAVGQLENYRAELAAAQDGGKDPNAPQYDAPAEGVTRYPMGDDAVPLDFTPSADDALKGTIKAADGTNVKAGTYTAADGTVIAVSVGNKASIKDDVL